MSDSRKLTKSELQASIKELAKQANQRLSDLKSQGLYSKNIPVQSKWDVLLRTTKYGTSRGKFSAAVSGKSRKDLLQQYTQIRNFLNQKTRPEDTQRALQRQADKYNIDVEDVSDMLELYGRNFGTDFVGHSDIIMQIISERLGEGQSRATIKRAIRRGLSSAKSQDEFIQKFSKGRGNRRYI